MLYLKNELYFSQTAQQVTTRIPEAIPDSPKMVDDVETVVSPVVDVEEGCDPGQCLADDFSPETMDKIESVMQNLDAGHLKLKQKEMVIFFINIWLLLFQHYQFLT